MIDEQAIAQGSGLANQNLQQMLAGIAPLFQAAEQVIQKKMPKPQMPPDVQASLQIAQAETARKAEYDKATFQMKQQEMGIQAKMDAADAAFKQQLETFKAQSAAQADQYSQQVEIIKNEADNKQHQMTELLKNADDNRTAMEIKMLELQGQVQTLMNPPAPEVTQQPDLNPQVAQMSALLQQIEQSKVNDGLSAVMQGLQATIAQMNAPKRVVRGPDGRAEGIEVINQGVAL